MTESKNESKSLRLFLAEFSLSVLVFAVVSAFCVGAFAAAIKTARDTEYLDAAVLAAENAAESLKAAEKPPEKQIILLGEDLAPATGRAFLKIEVTPKPAPEGLAAAGITVRNPGSGKKIYSLETAWQIPIQTSEVVSS